MPITPFAARIALVGRSGAGKTTVASLLRDEHRFVVCNTGARCRTLAREFFGTESKAVLNQLTDAMRCIDPAIWLKVALRQLVGGEAWVVIDAIRFHHDYDYARQNGFAVWRIQCPTAIRESRLSARGQVYNLEFDDSHSSEAELDGAYCDVVIDNRHGLRSLCSKIDAALRGLANS